ncbi:MAG TPA: hypothetical protein VL978_16255 [Puia sp.]|nr:hypothetical protein [Puia sp.]
MSNTNFPGRLKKSGWLKELGWRALFIFFFLLAAPLDWKYYRRLFQLDWGHLSYGAIFDLAHYVPGNWGILPGVTVAGAVVWYGLGRVEVRRDGAVRADGRKERLYYWLRVIVRYRLAVGIIAYGFIKLFPLLSPYPSISNLNTDYGDFTRWKLFSLSLGIVPGYESFLGAVEIVSGLLLFFRKTASVGAFIIAVFLGNVFMSNLAYGGGEAVYSLYLISLALFVLSWDARRLFDLLILQKQALPNRFRPVFARRWERVARLGLKGGVIFFFVILYGFKTKKEGQYQFPVSKGLPGAAGVYNVSLFVLGRDTLAYSKTDPVRWQDVVLENWATLSIRSNRPVVLDSTNTERLDLPSEERDYELAGSAGRHYYRYVVDTADRVLVLENKNPHYDREKGVLHYERPSGTRIVLTGVLGSDSVYAVLDRVDRKYLLEEARKHGRQEGIKL